MEPCHQNHQIAEGNENVIDDVTAKIRQDLFYKYVWPHRNLVYKLCINYTEDQEDIEDNYNEALANFYKYIETYDPKKSIQTWLHIITKRLVFHLNVRNRSYKDEHIDVESLHDLYEVEYEGYGLMSDSDENLKDSSELNTDYQECYSDPVMEALLSLKPMYREAIILQQQGYKIKEMTEICYKRGTLKVKNDETMKSRLWVAKQQLMKMIDRNGNRRPQNEVN